jgi:hypothetical protein
MMPFPTNTVSRSEFDRLKESSGYFASHGHDVEGGFHWLRVTKPSDDPAKEMNSMYICYEEQHQ